MEPKRMVSGRSGATVRLMDSFPRPHGKALALRASVRSLLSDILSVTPDFRGKGRVTMFLDRFVTDYENPRSYQVLGKLNGGVNFYFDLRAWGQKFAYYYHGWEREHIDTLRALYSGGVFVDIGSSLGLYVVCLGQTVREAGGSIISIEPVPGNLERQKRNVVLNDPHDLVTYAPLALGAEVGRAMVCVDPTMADNNAIISAEGSLTVDVVPLDDLVVRGAVNRIGMIKMDVEGYEPMVIEGGRRTILEHMPIIFAEFNRERMNINRFTIDQAWGFMVGKLGYRCYWFPPGCSGLVSIESPGEKENLLFIPPNYHVPDWLLDG